MICDFCSDPSPRWRYPASTFTAFGNPQDGGGESVGDWSACDLCHALISAGDREGLQVRSIDEFICAHPDAILYLDSMRDWTANMHGKFFLHRAGEPSLIT